MQVSQALQAVRRRWVVVLVATIALPVVVAVATHLRAPVYTATARGYVSVSKAGKTPPSVLTSGSLYILARMTSYATLANSEKVLQPVATTLGPGTDIATLRSEVSASSEVNTTFVDISVTDRDPRAAARIANVTIAQLGQVIQAFENGTIKMTVATSATVPTAPSNRKLTLDVAVAVFAGLLLGVGVALAVDVRSRRRQRRPDLVGAH